MPTDAQIKAQLLIDMQPIGTVDVRSVVVWMVQVLQFLLLEKVKGE